MAEQARSVAECCYNEGCGGSKKKKKKTIPLYFLRENNIKGI